MIEINRDKQEETRLENLHQAIIYRRSYSKAVNACEDFFGSDWEKVITKFLLSNSKSNSYERDLIYEFATENSFEELARECDTHP